MITLRFNEIAAALGLPAADQNPAIESVVADSRKVDYGSLFAALPGSQVDGHEFARTAVELGAVALLVRKPQDLPVPQLVVRDTLVALGQIAKMVRTRLHPVVVGITGSNGKTTVKEMLASILRQQDEVLATQGNFNNELGVPLTLFRLRPEHRFAVLELGASKAGDIAYLSAIAQPDVGVVTNVGPAHLEGFGSEEGVAAAKGEIFASLPATGFAILNGDQPWCEMWRRMNSAGGVLLFGSGRAHDVRFEQLESGTRMLTPAGGFDVRLTLPGTHNLMNAAAATAAAFALDVPLEKIRLGLEAVEPVPGRLNLIRTDEGWTVIDDTYNANPASLYSALQVLAGMQGTPWLVLGDMKELGGDSRKLHAEVGDAAKALGVKRIFAIGEMAANTVDSFGQGARHYADHAELIAALQSELRPGINCLVKGSRSMGMESVVQAVRSQRVLQEAC
jgi:UDP-N-acetylmuramoyl-tripeptide--D-alanyl-D-alanine ligase